MYTSLYFYWHITWFVCDDNKKQIKLQIVWCLWFQGSLLRTSGQHRKHGLMRRNKKGPQENKKMEKRRGWIEIGLINIQEWPRWDDLLSLRPPLACCILGEEIASVFWLTSSQRSDSLSSSLHLIVNIQDVSLVYQTSQRICRKHAPVHFFG